MPALHSRSRVQPARRFGTVWTPPLVLALFACSLGFSAAFGRGEDSLAKEPLMAANETGQEAPKTDDKPTPAPTPEPSAREKEVKAFVEHYFKVWSDQDMNAYDDCFMTDASIQYIDHRGQLFTYPRQRFVASQREIHRRSTTRSIEVPLTTEIRFEQEFARAVVYWKLTSGTRVQKGYDHFTLKQDRGRWRIVNLLFYATSDNEEE